MLSNSLRDNHPTETSSPTNFQNIRRRNMARQDFNKDLFVTIEQSFCESRLDAFMVLKNRRTIMVSKADAVKYHGFFSETFSV